ncbi:MAG: HlyD family efflux transporter periplasmic adaptor subunit [Anaerolineaceae bacterium]|nr:HlyD family efflux transporter periplasmic adaptor subunit [Anaerolineaceae bacterium]
MNKKLPARLLLVPLVLLGWLLVTSCSPGSPATWLGTEATPAPTPTPLPTAVVPEKPTYTVERGEVMDSLTFTGRVSPLNEAELYFRTDGRVLQVYVERGQPVRAGDRLAELDVSALHRQLAQANLVLETALTDLQTAEDERAYNLARAQVNLETEIVALNKLKGYDPAADLAVTRADLESATISLARAQGRYDAVAHEPDIAMRPEAQALQEATLAYERALAAHNQAVRQGEQRAYDVQAQEKRVKLARLEVERLQAGVDPRLEQAVAKAELDLADLRAQITDTLILAPFDGEVTAINTAAGRSVEGFRPVIVVADPRELEVTGELSSDDMGELSEGQEATAVPVEFPGQTLPATIRLLPYPYGSGGSAPSASGGDAEEADRATHLDVQFGALAVEPGDLVRVTVVLERKEDVLWLPPAAIRTFEGRKFVVIQEGAIQRRVDVTVGIESDDRVEIVSGVEEGDVVVGP